MDTIGSRIKYVREKAGDTKSAFSENIGRNVGYCHRIERDMHPNMSLSVLRDVSEAYDVSLDWLLFGDNKPIEPVVSLTDLDPSVPILKYLSSNFGVSIDTLTGSGTVTE